MIKNDKLQSIYKCKKSTNGTFELVQKFQFNPKVWPANLQGKSRKQRRPGVNLLLLRLCPRLQSGQK